MFIFLLSFLELKAQFKVPRVLKHPSLINIEYIQNLNSTFPETNLCISPDGQYMFFMSLRGGQPWSSPRIQKNKKVFDGDIWYSQKKNGQWGYPQVLGSNVNTNDGEDEPNISADGQSVIFQSWKSNWQVTGGPYYQSSLMGTQWGVSKGLGGGISQFFNDLANQDAKNILIQLGSQENNYATDGATVSADGKTFVVAVGQYTGKMDLYISRKNESGYWSYLKRLPVSTLGNERSPFLAADGKTLYFASDGYGGWGGLDIHKTTIHEDDTCGEVVNIGAPFNTWQDDYGFVLTASGDEVYFVREGDIYFANTKNANPELKPVFSTLMITGKVILSKTKKPTQANIKIIDPETLKVIGETKSNALTGEYAIIVNNNIKKINQEITKSKYHKQNKELVMPTLKEGLNKVIVDIELISEEELMEDKENAASFGEDKGI
jgi:hypothetical protein